MSIVYVGLINVLCLLFTVYLSFGVYFQLIKQCQDELVPENANILLYSKNFGKDGVCDMEEEWFHTKYCMEGNLAHYLTEVHYFGIEPSNYSVCTRFTL